MKQKELGKLGEDTAAEQMKREGFQILERNWRCKCGEIDIIARRGYTLAFVEVKTRATLQFGTPAEAITRVKKEHIRRAADYYLKIKNYRSVAIRFDVVEIYMRHIPQAF